MFHNSDWCLSKQSEDGDKKPFVNEKIIFFVFEKIGFGKEASYVNSKYECV